MERASKAMLSVWSSYVLLIEFIDTKLLIEYIIPCICPIQHCWTEFRWSQQVNMYMSIYIYIYLPVYFKPTHMLTCNFRLMRSERTCPQIPGSWLRSWWFWWVCCTVSCQGTTSWPVSHFSISKWCFSSWFSCTDMYDDL